MIHFDTHQTRAGTILDHRGITDFLLQATELHQGEGETLEVASTQLLLSNHYTMPPNTESAAVILLLLLSFCIENNSLYVTRSRKRGHFAQEFKIELLVLKGRVASKQ